MNAMRGCQPRIEIYFDNIFIAHAISSNFCIGLNEKTKRQVRTARVATHKRNRYRYVMIHCISTFDRAVPFDIFTSFRGRHKYSGGDTLALSSVEGARIFDKLKPKFEQGLLKPFPINPACIYGLSDAAKSYSSVLRGTPDRVLLEP